MSVSDKENEALRVAAGAAAADLIEPGMVVGLGTGRTAEAFMLRLAERVRAGLSVYGIATSYRTAAFARNLDIVLTDLEVYPSPDIAVDGADEIDGSLSMIKGGGGALLREKIVACAAQQMLVLVDGGKVVETLGAFALPIEVVDFGVAATTKHIARAVAACGLSGRLDVRGGDPVPFRTDGGNLIIDASFERIDDPERLAGALKAVPGVVEHGLFLGIASRAIVARPGGIEWMETPRKTETDPS